MAHDWTGYLPCVVGRLSDILDKYPCAASAAYLWEMACRRTVPGMEDCGCDDKSLAQQSRMWAANARRGNMDPELSKARLALYEIATDAYRDVVASGGSTNVSTEWLRARVQQAAIVASNCVTCWLATPESERKYWRSVIDMLQDKE